MLFFLCSGSNIWDNRMSFARFFWNQLWLSFGWSTRKLKLFPGKVNLKERSVSYSKMNTLLFLCYYFSRWLWNVFFCRKWKVPLAERRWTVCSSFKINTTSWVLHLTKMSDVFFFFCCVLLISTMICFAFFWWKEWQVLDGVAVLGHFQHRDWLFANAS